MTRLEIALLGELRLQGPDGGSIPIASQKGALLLALLAQKPGRMHRREVIQAMLWPESDQPHAQGNLRFVLHQLRKALVEHATILQSDHQSVWLESDRVNVDV